MPQQDADVLKVLIGQMWECRDINPVFGKTLAVLGHAELFEPVCNLLHGGPPDLTPSVLDQPEAQPYTPTYCSTLRKGGVSGQGYAWQTTTCKLGTALRRSVQAKRRRSVPKPVPEWEKAWD